MNHNIIDWLLEKENPSIRYYTLTKLLDKPNDDIDVVKAKKSIMEIGDVVKILDKQNEDGSWDDPEKFYRSKYKGTVWTLIILAELGVDPNDPRIKKACEYVLNNSQHKDSGGFMVDSSPLLSNGLPKYIIPCLTGNMVFSLIKLGYLEDERVQKAINWIIKYQRTDDGDTSSSDEYHKGLQMCYGKHSCHMGVAKSLKALVAIPEGKRNKQVNEKIKEFTNYFLIHHIFKKSHNLTEDSKPAWRRLGFPLMYHLDVLEILGLFNELKIKDERLNEAIHVIKRLQMETGDWKLQTTYNGRTIINIEKKSLPSKWITMKSLIVLNNY